MDVIPGSDGLHVTTGLFSKKETVLPWNWIVITQEIPGAFDPRSALRIWVANPLDPTKKQSVEVDHSSAAAIVAHPSFPHDLIFPETATRLAVDPGSAHAFGPSEGPQWIEGPKKGTLGLPGPAGDLVHLAYKTIPKAWGNLFAADIVPFKLGVAFRVKNPWPRAERPPTPKIIDVARWSAIGPSRLPAPHGAYWVALFGVVDTGNMIGYVLTLDQAQALVGHASADVWNLPDNVYAALGVERRHLH